MSSPTSQVRVYAPGADITAEATATVTARRFVKISGNRTAGGNVAVDAAGAGDRVFGVTADDASAGGLVRVARGGVVKVVAGAAITAGADVQSNASAAAVPASTGTVVGIAVTGAANGGTAEIALI
jgi:hypothetical protein